MTTHTLPATGVIPVAVDDNLPLPSDLPSRTGAVLSSHHRLEEMVDAVASKEAVAMFAPVGLLPAFESAAGVPYDIVAQATVGRSRSQRIGSRLVVRRDSPVRTPEEAIQGRVARVNGFCTTSFWAPLVSLADRLPAGTPVTFADCAGFTDMLASVVDGRSDAAMVWDVVLGREAELAAQVRPLIADVALPAPVVVVRRDAPAASAHLTETLTGYRPHQEEDGFFSGLDRPDLTLIERFRRDMAAALAHFDVRG